jgi:hypothetical protein
MSVAVLTVGIGLVAGAPAARAGSFCGWTGGWAPITLVNGWTSEQNAYDTGDPSYCLEADGMVYLSGSIASAPGWPVTMFATLPPAVRPAHVIYLDVYTQDGGHGILCIHPDGTMYAYGGSATGYTSLAGVSFPAAGNPQTGIMPLQNGWQSGQGTYSTGDPSYSVSNGIAHLSGSLTRPAGPPVTHDDFFPFTLPSQAAPSGTCDFTALTYAYGGGIGHVLTDGGGGLAAFDNKYTSLAGINYPTGPTAWQQMTLLNGALKPVACPAGPAYLISGNVVYLTGDTLLAGGFSGEIAVLPPAARPAHYLYMIADNYDASDDSNNQVAADDYVTLMIDPNGGVWIYNSPPAPISGNLVYFAGLSFHTLS